MRERNGIRFALFGVATLMTTALACNAFAGRVEPSLPPPPTRPAVSTETSNDAGPIALAPTATLPADATPDIATPDADDPALHALVDINVRNGPGVRYERVGFLLRDETARIIGVDPESGWWKIVCPPRATGAECWVSGRPQYTTAFNVSDVPAVTPDARLNPGASPP